MKDTLKNVYQTFKILGYVLTPLLILNQIKSVASATPPDKITTSLKQTNYYLRIQKQNKTYTYKLTHQDILNLLRAVYKEGKQEKAVAWSLINRFGLLYPNTYNNFTTFIKAYAQPINPAWFPNGSKFKEYYQRTSNKKLALEQAKERVRYSKLQLDEIPAYEQSIVFGILDGTIPNPVPNSVHYVMSMASPGDTEEQARFKQKRFTDSRSDLDKPIYYESSTRGNNWFFSAKAPPIITKVVKKVIV